MHCLAQLEFKCHGSHIPPTLSHGIWGMHCAGEMAGLFLFGLPCKDPTITLSLVYISSCAEGVDVWVKCCVMVPSH